jgi:catechol 2,3-dioxygenase-like lactoylglutathione lyase family enzyme
MIIGLDHTVLLVRELEAGVDAYQTLLGVAPAWRTRGEGADTAIFTLANASLELMAPAGDGSAAARVRAALDAQGEGLASLAFRVDDVARYHRRLSRLALGPEDVGFAESRDETSGVTLAWKRTRADKAATRGVRCFFLELERARPHSDQIMPAPVTAMDHVVVSTADPERAAALYGARLGLDMALDQRAADGRTSLMFFRCGDLIVEVMREDAAKDDKLWGISWRVADIQAAHARLAAAGADISEVREGRRDGTHVFTVRDGTCGVQTLMIEIKK